MESNWLKIPGFLWYVKSFWHQILTVSDGKFLNVFVISKLSGWRCLDICTKLKISNSLHLVRVFLLKISDYLILKKMVVQSLIHTFLVSSLFQEEISTCVAVCTCYVIDTCNHQWSIIFLPRTVGTSFLLVTLTTNKAECEWTQTLSMIT